MFPYFSCWREEIQRIMNELKTVSISSSSEFFNNISTFYEKTVDGEVLIDTGVKRHHLVNFVGLSFIFSWTSFRFPLSGIFEKGVIEVWLFRWSSSSKSNSKLQFYLNKLKFSPSKTFRLYVVMTQEERDDILVWKFKPYSFIHQQVSTMKDSAIQTRNYKCILTSEFASPWRVQTSSTSQPSAACTHGLSTVMSGGAEKKYFKTVTKIIQWNWE